MTLDSLDCHTVRELVTRLRTILGTELLGLTLGLSKKTEGSTLDAWEQGSSCPDEEDLERLQCTDECLRTVALYDGEDVARAWFMGGELSSCAAWQIRVFNLDTATALARQHVND